MKRLVTGTAIACVLSVMAPFSAEAVTLKETLKATYEFNPELKSERANLEAVDEDLSQAIAGFRPTISAGYDRGRQRTQIGAAAENTRTTESKDISIQQPIFNGFGTVKRVEGNRYRVRAAREQLRSKEQEILLNAVTSYMDVVRDTSVLEFSRNNEKVLEEQLKAVRDRFAVGEVTRTDVAQAEARLSIAVSGRVQAEGNLVTSKATYVRIVGEAPENLSAEFEMPILPNSLEEATQMARAGSPDLKRAEFLTKSGDSAVDASMSSLLPSVALVGSMERSTGNTFMGGGDVENDSVVMNVSIPLYQSGAEYSRIRQAQSNHERTKQSEADTHNRLLENVVQAWKTVETDRAIIKSNEDAIKAAEVALDGVRQEEQYGARTTLDVLDAEQELFQAQVNFVRSQRDYAVAVFDLAAVLGKLTAEGQKIDTEAYDPDAHYRQVKYKILGF